MEVKSSGDNWELCEQDVVSYYVTAKPSRGSWSATIECRSCDEGVYSDTAEGFLTPDQAMTAAKIKAGFHHLAEHSSK